MLFWANIFSSCQCGQTCCHVFWQFFTLLFWVSLVGWSWMSGWWEWSKCSDWLERIFLRFFSHQRYWEIKKILLFPTPYLLWLRGVYLIIPLLYIEEEVKCLLSLSWAVPTVRAHRVLLYSRRWQVSSGSTYTRRPQQTSEWVVFTVLHLQQGLCTYLLLRQCDNQKHRCAIFHVFRQERYQQY